MIDIADNDLAALADFSVWLQQRSVAEYAVIAGGFVRDALLERRIAYKDIDVFVDVMAFAPNIKILTNALEGDGYKLLGNNGDYPIGEFLVYDHPDHRVSVIIVNDKMSDQSWDEWIEKSFDYSCDMVFMDIDMNTINKTDNYQRCESLNRVEMYSKNITKNPNKLAAYRSIHDRLAKRKVLFPEREFHLI